MQGKVYFKNLNALRFFAALIVLLYHIGPLKKAYGADGYFGREIFAVDSKVGVLLFFVLSGFLISYLLLQEIKLTGTIDVRAFYIRRILRIWPLYFLIIILSLAVFPNIDMLALKDYSPAMAWERLGIKIFFFCIMMPNLALMLGGNIAYATQTWTIGVEEQFYLLWPWFFKKFKNTFRVCVAVIITYLAILYLLDYFSYVHRYVLDAKVIWEAFPISCLAIGGLYAQLIFTENAITAKIKRVIFTGWFQLIMMAVLIFLVAIQYTFAYCDSELYAVLLGYQVCNFAANPKRLFSLENRLLSYLGKISYGLYMFHPVVIILGLNICMKLEWRSIWILYMVVIALSVGIAAISYHFYESYFIRKKIRYSKVISGDNANATHATPV